MAARLRRPGADVALRDAVPVHIDARARAAESILVTACDDHFAGADAPLEALARFFTTRLAEPRRLHAFDPDALAVAAQGAAVERHAALARPCGNCEQRQREEHRKAGPHEPIVRFRPSPPKAILRIEFVETSSVARIREVLGKPLFIEA